MNEQLRMRLGAVTLALLTLAAVIFAALNFQQRSRFVVPDDGVTWMDSAQGVIAWHVVTGGPADGEPVEGTTYRGEAGYSGGRGPHAGGFLGGIDAGRPVILHPTNEIREGIRVQSR